MSQPPDNEIARRDEVLELLYWLEGEGIGGAAQAEGMARFLGWPAELLTGVLRVLVRRGDVVEGAGGAYRLTEQGRREAAVRFAEDFATMLGQGHGECSDPNCDCHTDPGSAAECHAARSHASHGH